MVIFQVFTLTMVPRNLWSLQEMEALPDIWHMSQWKAGDSLSRVYCLNYTANCSSSFFHSLAL